ncbi:glycosyltransferase family 2 protein [Alteromonas oceanisediminis]|uniref:glycosyltransferase family 2 protein n=1 Tax=Alteromonas oceanisediminis TaxID=2836180 RepID=UPI001BD927A9|nr:glycosyltransferase family 2 protein [Alteromonas oceanisediminis]MBT0585679.1 glycosyltransferase family 2 protein [Alteromonas oceanisediminis]
MSSPLISVIMPAFNAENTIEKAIGSVMAQNAQLELFVVDDASTDNTVSVVQALAEKDNRITLLHNQRSKGPSGARNSGLLSARGEYLAFLDADDTWYDNHLSTALGVFANSPDADVLLLNFDIYDVVQAQFVGTWFEKKQTLFGAWDDASSTRPAALNAAETLFTNSFLHLQAVVLKTPSDPVLFDETLTRAEDRDFFIRLFQVRAYNLYLCNTVTGTYFLHESSLTSKTHDSLVKTEKALIAFYDKHLNEMKQTGNTGIQQTLRRHKAAACYELSYQLRQIGELKAAFHYSLAGLATQWSSKQCVELAKVCVSPVLTRK